MTDANLGAWLIKVNPKSSPVDEFLRTDFATVTTRCVQPTYRLDEVAPGQAVLFWISGDDKRHPAGLYAQGHTTGLPRPALDGPRLDLPVRLTNLDPPVLSRELLEHPRLSQLEVLKVPAGSNPSYLTRDQLDELRSLYPQVTVGWRRDDCRCPSLASPSWT